MRVALAVAVPLAAALLQGSVVPFMSIAGVRPSLPLLVAASWSVAAGAREAVWWAFIGGLAADLLSGGPLGAQALASLVPVAAIGLGDAYASRPRTVLTGAVLVGTASAAAGLLYLALLAAVGQPLTEPALLAGAALVSGGYNGVLAIATYPIARSARRATEKQASFGW